jgi:hypothetical protein
MAPSYAYGVGGFLHPPKHGSRDAQISTSQTIMMRPFQSGGGGYAITSDWMHFRYRSSLRSANASPGVGVHPALRSHGHAPG